MSITKRTAGILLSSLTVISAGWTEEETLRQGLEREIQHMLLVDAGWTKVSVSGWAGSVQVQIENANGTALYRNTVTEDDKDYKGDIIILPSPEQFDRYIFIEVHCQNGQDNPADEGTISVDGKGGVHIELTIQLRTMTIEQVGIPYIYDLKTIQVVVLKSPHVLFPILQAFSSDGDYVIGQTCAVDFVEVLCYFEMWIGFQTYAFQFWFGSE